jgi:transposase
MYPIAELELLTIQDIAKIFHVSEVTIYRWAALARRGKSKFPKPVGDRRQKLLWHRHSIENYCHANEKFDWTQEDTE